MTGADFYTRAFGLKRRFMTDGGEYAELETGATTLSFANRALAETHFEGGVAPMSDRPAPMEIGLVTEDVAAAFERAVAAGATPLAAPAPETGTTGTEIYLRCHDLSVAIARVQAAGARALSPRAKRPWGDEAAYFADPDGNVVVLAK